jgi:hypothetical protein
VIRSCFGDVGEIARTDWHDVVVVEHRVGVERVAVAAGAGPEDDVDVAEFGLVPEFGEVQVEAGEDRDPAESRSGRWSVEGQFFRSLVTGL